MLLRHVQLERNGQRLLRCEELRLPSPGISFLVGPGGAGKSSLLTALAEHPAGPEASLRAAFAEGGPLPAPCVHVPQHVRLAQDGRVSDALRRGHALDAERFAARLKGLGLAPLAEQMDVPVVLLNRSERRVLAVLAQLCREAPLYLVDEPTADLEDGDIDAVRRTLGEISARACVLMATHNRQDCLTLGGQVLLLAGGEVQEVAPSARFFAQPQTAAGKLYVETGNCSLPREQAPPGKDGLWWPVPGLLCGMSRPNLLHSAEPRLRDIAARGIRHLVCLEERVPYAAQVARDAGLMHYHVPVPDMAPPSFNQAVDLCRTLEPAIRANQAVAMHCRGGLGRTGTGLAALLIWFGDSADEAIAKIRRAQPLAIQSNAQLRFLHDFADRISGWHSPVTPNSEVTHVTR